MPNQYTFATAGTVVEWGDISIAGGENTEIVVNWSGDALPLARDYRASRFNLDIGTVIVRSFSRDGSALSGGVHGSSSIQPSTRGVKKTLRVVQGAGVWFEADCIYMGSELTLRVNDVARYEHRFRITETLSTVPPTTSYQEFLLTSEVTGAQFR